MRGGLNHVDAGDADGADGGQNARGADADGGGFAGAVGAEQAEDFALANAEINAVHCDDALLAFVDLSQAFNLDNHCGFSNPQSCIFSIICKRRGTTARLLR